MSVSFRRFLHFFLKIGVGGMLVLSVHVYPSCIVDKWAAFRTRAGLVRVVRHGGA